MNEQLRAISNLDRVIHEPGRLMIFALLGAVKECDFLHLLHETEMNKGNLSSHLARLEEAGYVEIEKTYRGKVPRTLLRLTRAGRAAFDQYLKGLKAAIKPAGRRAEVSDNAMTDWPRLRIPRLSGHAG